ncbi:hypothetical protein COL26b_014411 [Colletotrichum chrysophilum]|uniref:uncharacterized protein n=1 Tax=Colletotrichum chrysophilum TaxID=1836956 RepID=UPI00230055EC|nr:uncharacterized protein COL26b_014411 [Colletotrichum chrysophilum]KAJ0359097.1 hypothetical protein COL26b_014411 [Colletotrichum chrysophilum]
MAQTQDPALGLANAHVKRFTAKVEEGTIFKLSLGSFYTDRAHNIDGKHVIKGLALDFANDPKVRPDVR